MSRKPNLKNVKQLKEVIEQQRKLEERERKKYEEMVKEEEKRAKLRRNESVKRRKIKFKEFFFRVEDGEECFLVKFNGTTVGDLIKQINEENDFDLEKVGSIQKMRRKVVTDLDTDLDSNIFKKVKPYDILLLRKEKKLKKEEKEEEEEDEEDVII